MESDPEADGRTWDETAEPADEAGDLHLDGCSLHYGLLDGCSLHYGLLDGCSLHYGLYKSQQLEILLARSITNAVPAFSFCCFFTLSVQSVFFQSLFWINLGFKAEIIKATTYMFLYMFLN